VWFLVLILGSFVEQFHFILPISRIIMGLAISVVVGLVCCRWSGSRHYSSYESGKHESCGCYEGEVIFY